MLTLTILYCVADLSACQRQITPGYTTPVSCLMTAQQSAAEWGANHPGYRVTNWSCRK